METTTTMQTPMVLWATDFSKAYDQKARDHLQIILTSLGLPAQWIHVKIVVAGDKARLYVNRAEQPTLIVNDVKTGAAGRGAVALWFEGSTIAHYANLRIQPAQ